MPSASLNHATLSPFGAVQIPKVVAGFYSSVRVALGAGRIRLVRQGLTESAVLSGFGGTLGVLIAGLSVRPFVAFWPGSLPRAEEIQLDWRVLAFAVGISLLSGLLFGLAPALRGAGLTRGLYVFPFCTHKDMKSRSFWGCGLSIV